MIENEERMMMFSSFGLCSPLLRDKFINTIGDIGPSELRCAVIPFAGVNYSSTFQRERDGLILSGFKSENVFLVESPGDLYRLNPDCIYVPGGNPYRLLRELKDRDLINAIRDAISRGAIYVGVSAGACVATCDIDYVRCVEDNCIDLDDYAALGLISDIILCHFDHYSYSILKECEARSGRKAITLKDDQMVVVKNGAYFYVE